MKRILLAAYIALSPLAAAAHGAPPVAQHGGAVAEASNDYWIEMVMSGSEITVYVNDETNKPVASAQVAGTARLLVGGKSQQIVLAPAGANRLAGKLDSLPAGKVTSVISLTIGGKATQVRFAISAP